MQVRSLTDRPFASPLKNCMSRATEKGADRGRLCPKPRTLTLNQKHFAVRGEIATRPQMGLAAGGGGDLGGGGGGGGGLHNEGISTIKLEIYVCLCIHAFFHYIDV